MDRILVVDDDQWNRALLEEEISDAGYQSIMAEDGEMALRLIQDNRVDLVLLDIMMPRISGIDVLKELRQTFTVADLPIIMVTAKHQSEDIVQALNIGANDYIVKPIDFPVLLARIRTHLRLKKLSQQKDEFMSIASHDLKNSLTSIIGSVRLLDNMLGKEQFDRKQVLQFLSTISDSAKEMFDLIVDFLDFNAVEDGRLVINTEPVDIADIADRSIRNHLEYAREKDIKLELKSDTNLSEFTADPSRIKQVIDNFITNAIKFCPNDSHAVVKIYPCDGGIRFEVTDNGPGLTDEDMKKAFIKYGMLSNMPTGGERSFGLGLALCKQIVDLHDGEIGVYNNELKGATFWFTLPVGESTNE